MKAEMLQPLARQLLSDSQTRGALATELARALARGRPCSWSDGEKLCAEGEDSDALYVVMKGQIRVLREDSSGVPKELTVLSAPVLVGHMGLVDGSNRSATCEAIDEVAGLSLSRSSFHGLMEDDSAEGTAFRRLILNQMMQQLSRANGRIRGMIRELEDHRLDAHGAGQQAWREQMRAQATKKGRPTESERLRRIAGVLDGWDMRVDGHDSVQFTEDDATRRRGKGRGRR